MGWVICIGDVVVAQGFGNDKGLAKLFVKKLSAEDSEKYYRIVWEK